MSWFINKKLPSDETLDGITRSIPVKLDRAMTDDELDYSNMWLELELKKIGMDYGEYVEWYLKYYV